MPPQASRLSSIFKAWLPLAAVVGAFALSVTWAIGYELASMESMFALGAALLLALLLAAATATNRSWQYMVMGVFIASMLDVFVFKRDGAAFVGFVLCLGLIFHFRKSIQPAFFIVFALVMLAGVVLHGRPTPYQPVPRTQVAADDGGPILVHLLMDEMGSFNSIPQDEGMKAEITALRAEYAKRGFTVFDDMAAVSPNTEVSVSEVLNLGKAPSRKNYADASGFYQHKAVNNEVYDLFAANRWNVSVLQSDWIDVCSKDYSCGRYSRGNHVKEYANIGITRTQRIRLLVFEAATLLTGGGRGLWYLHRIQRKWPELLDSVLPVRSGYASRTVGVLRIMDDEIARLKTVPGHSAAFVHLLVPHFPWVVDKSCKLKRIEDWRISPWQHSMRGVDQQSLVQAYWDQAYCAHTRVLASIDELDRTKPGRYWFVIHGDHGPRMMPSEAAKALGEKLHTSEVDPATGRNLLHTFVAIRTPGSTQKAAIKDGSMQDLVRSELRRVAVSSGKSGRASP